MRFDIVDTLEIPQGATELTTSELKQISGGWCPKKKEGKNKKEKKGKKENCKENRKDNDN